MIDTTPIIAGIVIGSGLGSIAVRFGLDKCRTTLIANLRVKLATAEQQEAAWRDDCAEANGALLRANLSVLNAERRIEQLKVVNTALHQELAVFVEERKRRLEPLQRANAARHAKRLEREARERLISQVRHSEMRRKLGVV